MPENNTGIPEDMLEAIETFDKQAKSIVQDFFSENYSQQAPERIYHYTDSTGLLGILEGGNIPLGDITVVKLPETIKPLNRGYKELHLPFSK